MRVLLAFLMLSVIAGCTDQDRTNEMCSVFEAIYLQAEDHVTGGTADRLVNHNRKVACFCGDDSSACAD